MANSTPACDIGVDIGGTFTDIVVRDARGVRTLKIPTTRGDPSQAVLHALRELSDAFAIQPDAIARFLHGTTIATNAVLERKGRKDRPHRHARFQRRAGDRLSAPPRAVWHHPADAVRPCFLPPVASAGK